MFFETIEKDFEKISQGEFSRPVKFSFGSTSQEVNCLFFSSYYTLNAAGLKIQSKNPQIKIAKNSFFEKFLIELTEEIKNQIVIEFENQEYYISRIEPDGVKGLILILKNND